MSIELYSQDFVVRVIRSCENSDQLNSCRDVWVPHLIKSGAIRDEKVIHIIQYELNEKEKDLEYPRKEKVVLPYLKRRAEKINREEEERRKHLKLVQPLKEDRSF